MLSDDKLWQRVKQLQGRTLPKGTSNDAAEAFGGWDANRLMAN